MIEAPITHFIHCRHPHPGRDPARASAGMAGFGCGTPGRRGRPLLALSGMTTDRRARIETKLKERLEASHVEVVDESHLHVGHAGAASGGGHFRALVVADRFDGQNAVARQRQVYSALDDEMGSEIHALSIRALTPEEWTRRVAE